MDSSFACVHIHFIFSESKTELLCKTGTNSKLRSCPIPKRLSHGDEVLPAKGEVLQAEKDQVHEKKVSLR